MGCFVRVGKNSMGHYVQGDKNSRECFVRGGKSLWDVLSRVAKNGMGCFVLGCFVWLPLDTHCPEPSCTINPFCFSLIHREKDLYKSLDFFLNPNMIVS